MIDLNPDIVAFIADKAREFQVQEPLAGPEQDEPADEVEALTESWSEVPSSGPGDIAYHELESAIQDLEPDQQISLVALMWLGRGDFDLNEWDTALEEARQAFNNRTAEYVIGTPLAADYLEEGLRLHGYGEE